MGLRDFCTDLIYPAAEDRSSLLYSLLVGLLLIGPQACFLAYLARRAKASIHKLQSAQSVLMTTYYVFLWAVTLLFLLVRVWQFSFASTAHPTLWSTLWLLTRFGLVMLEVSVVVFLLQGYLVSGQEALQRTLWISGGLALLETVFAAWLVFHDKTPLFLYGGSAGPEGSGVLGDLQWRKWGFWLAHSLACLAVYGGMLVLPATRWRDRVPARPAFHRYTALLAAQKAVAAAGALLLGAGVAAGYCVWGLATYVFYSLYAPLLYHTFLREFLADEEGDLDSAYYAEMKDAGYFEEGDYDEHV